VSLIPERQALQPERTALAWQRTALTSMLLLLPLLLTSARVGAWWLVGATSAAAIVGAAMVLTVRSRFAELRDDTRGYSPWPPMVRVAVVTLLGAAGGVSSALYAVTAGR
jgi:hypothetical protein